MVVIVKKKSMDTIGIITPPAPDPIQGAPVVKKVVIAKPKPLSLRQLKVVSLVGKGGKSKADILRQAGYGKGAINTPAKVFDQPTVKAAVEPILDRLTRHRDRVLARMEKLVGKAGYTSLSITLAHMNKDIELLAGRPTAREEHVLPDDEKRKLDELLAMNS